MRFSAPVKEHWLGSFSIVLPFSGLRGFVPVVRERWEQGRPGAWGGRGAGGAGGDTMGGGGGGDPRAYIHLCVHMYICICVYSIERPSRMPQPVAQDAKPSRRRSPPRVFFHDETHEQSSSSTGVPGMRDGWTDRS